MARHVRLTVLCGWFVLAAAMAGGCASNQPTQKEQARKQWNSARANVLAGLARQQFDAGNFDNCRRTLDEAAKLDPNSVPVRILSARLAIEKGRLDLADQDLKLARSLDPKNAEADYYTGVIHQRWQKPQAAYEHYHKAAEKQPSELAYLLAAAEMLVAMDRSEDALSLLKDKLHYFENSPTIRDAVGQLLVQRGRHAEAVEILRQASLLAPEETPIRERLALALYYARQYREAAGMFDRLLKDEGLASRADLHTALGECRMQLNQPREARDSFELAAQHDPGSAQVWLNLAKAAIQLGDLRRAEASLRKATSLDAASAEAHLLTGYVRLRQERFEDALSAFQKASSLDPQDIVSLCMSGCALEKLGRPAEAMACYAKALKLKPGDELASKLMAQVQVND